MFGNPALNDFLKIENLPEKLICFGFTHNAGYLIAELVSLPPTPIQVSCCSSRVRPHDEFKRSKRGLVCSLALYTVAGTCNGHLRQKEPCLISQPEAIVCRKSFDPGIMKIAVYGLSQVA